MNNVLERAYALLEEVTPLATDCGAVCDGRCCRESADSEGMLLFPGEEVLLADAGYTIRPAEGGYLLTCGGTCNRALRPLACRIFPLFPTHQLMVCGGGRDLLCRTETSVGERQPGAGGQRTKSEGKLPAAVHRPLVISEDP